MAKTQTTARPARPRATAADIGPVAALCGLPLVGFRRLLRGVGTARQVVVRTSDRAERFVEARMTRLLNRLQIPTARDVQELSRRVEILTRRVAELDEQDARKGARTQRRSAARKRVTH